MSSSIAAGEPTLVGAAWRFRALVIGLAAAFALVTLAFLLSRPPVYTASATMVLQDPHSDPVFAAASSEPPDRYTGDQVAVLKSPQLAAAAAAVGARRRPPLALSADDFLKHTIVFSTPLSGNLVQLSFTASDPATALAGVDTVRAAYEQTVHDAVNTQLQTLLAQIDAELSAINAQLAAVMAHLPGTQGAEQQALQQQQTALLARRDTLNSKRDQVVVDAASGSNGVAVYLPPQAATAPSRLVSALPVTAALGVAGLFVGVIAAYVLAARRRVFRSRTEPGLVLAAPLIAEVPRFHRSLTLPVVEAQAGHPAAVAFRSAALFIQAHQPESTGRETSRRRTAPAPQRLVVTSVARRDGRSTLAANLGIALADAGVSTLLVDADVVTAGLSRLLHHHFELDPVVERDDRGAAHEAPGHAVADGEAETVPDHLALEDVVRPRGSSTRLALLRADHALRIADDSARQRLLEKAESGFSVVIIDAPPLTQSGPYWPLVRRAGGAVVLVNDGAPLTPVEELARLLNGVQIPVFGYVYNHRPRLRRAVREAAPVPALTSPSRPDAAVSAA